MLSQNFCERKGGVDVPGRSSRRNRNFKIVRIHFKRPFLKAHFKALHFSDLFYYENCPGEDPRTTFQPLFERAFWSPESSSAAETDKSSPTMMSVESAEEPP